MIMQIRRLPVLACAVVLLSIPSYAQTTESRQPNSTPKSQAQSAILPAYSNSIDIVANEIALLRNALQTLSLRLRELGNKTLAPAANQSGSSNDKQNRVVVSLDILIRAEQRAEFLRKQLLDLVEKETSLKSRIVQIEEDMRPESIERTMNLVGTTRTAELRDVRRRVLENERKGFESLLYVITQSRSRLEDDVRQADSLVQRIRQRLLPLVDKEIEKITPN